MGKFITSFEDHNAYQQAIFDENNTPNISLCKSEDEVHYQKLIIPDYTTRYFTLVAIDDCEFTFNCPLGNLSYSLDNGRTWSEPQSYESDILVLSGNKVLFKGNLCCAEYTSKPESVFESVDSHKFNVEGNIMSLIYGDNFINQTVLTHDYELAGLFVGREVVNAQNLILPATTLTKSCYAHMFNGCTLLTTAPALPATTLADYCYESMFEQCSSLENAPALPATTLADYCYDGMFWNCYSLINAPELPATTLAKGCYGSMFKSCSSLENAPELPATILEDSCYNSMFYDCASLVNAPELPATTLVDDCYGYMFGYCTSLNYIKCLATDISANGCTYAWIVEVASSGTFEKDANMNDWTIGYDGIPDGWIVQNAS